MSHHIKITALVVLVLAMALSIHADKPAPAPKSTAPIFSTPAPPTDTNKPAPATESTTPISSSSAYPADAVSPSSDGASVGISPSPGALGAVSTGDEIFSASGRPGALAGAGALVAAVVIAIYAM